MSEFVRFAIYYLPGDDRLADFGAGWLGWDVRRGTARAHPQINGLPLSVSDITKTPRRYGFHATLKPPFHLAENETLQTLQGTVGRLCKTLPPVTCQGLSLSNIGGFLALVVTGETATLASVAARIVTDLDGFRAPATTAEISRRRATGLTPQQDAHLVRWGYPYVLQEFRFHLTLSGKLPPAAVDATRGVLAPILEPLLPAPFVMDSVALVGQRADGRFEMIHHYTLSG